MSAANKTMWLLLLLVFAVTAKAQQPCYLTLNRQKGLPSDEVYNVYQDSKGYIWVATGDGLSRYDGSEFVSYKSDAQTSLHGSCIREDKYGRIWYENFDSYLYYADSGKLKSIHQSSPYYYVPFGISQQHLFTMTRAGVDVYNISTLRHVKTIEIPTRSSLYAAGAHNNYYVFTDNTLHTIGDDLILRSTELPGHNGDIAHNLFAGENYVFVTALSDRGTVLYKYNSKLVLEQTITIPLTAAIQSGNYINGQIYITTAVGCFMYAGAGVAEKEAASYFTGKSISGVIKDRQNNLWFSSTKEGLYVVPDINNRIYTIAGYTPNRIALAKDGFYAGTQGGELLHISAGFDKVHEISHSPGGSSIYYLYADSQQVLYSSTGFTTLPVTGKDKEQTLAVPVKHITRLDDKYYAFASSVYCGLLQNPGCSNTATSIWEATFNKGDKNGGGNIASIINIVRAKSVAYDTEAHLIFFATNMGIYSVTPDTITELTNNGKRIFANSLQVANGCLYALTPMGAVLKMPYTHADTGSGQATTLPLTNISLMRRFGNELYLFGGGSLHTLELSNGALNRLDINIDIHGINDMLKQDSQLLVVTNDGIIAVNSHTDTDRKPALFYINSIKANNKEMNRGQLSNLSYFENNISVTFSVLDFGTVFPATLYYRLNGGGWEAIPRESRALQFPSLSPGHYVISFRLGQDASTATSVSFYIKPAFWQQWWFYLICLVAVVAMVLVYYKRKITIRIRKLEAQKEKMQLEQDLGKSMLTSIRAQMNPHFFFNALNTIQAYIFTNDKIRASNYLAKFSRLTRTILEMSESETVLLSQEAETMKLYLELEKMRFDGSFEYDIQFIGIDNREMIEIPSMIIQPYVENAIKHGLLHKSGAKLLTILCTRTKNVLQVTIDDNGIGRKRSEELQKIQAEKYRSFSTKASEKRLELLNKGRSEKIKVAIIDKVGTNGYAEGTKVVLTIPI